jgi:ankyrin repeat protein
VLAMRGFLAVVAVVLLAGTAFATPVITSLHELARSGDATGLLQALQAEPARVNDNDAYGWTPLFWAVDGGHLDAVRVPNMRRS